MCTYKLDFTFLSFFPLKVSKLFLHVFLQLGSLKWYLIPHVSEPICARFCLFAVTNVTLLMVKFQIFWYLISFGTNHMLNPGYVLQKHVILVFFILNLPTSSVFSSDHQSNYIFAVFLPRLQLWAVTLSLPVSLSDCCSRSHSLSLMYQRWQIVMCRNNDIWVPAPGV